MFELIFHDISIGTTWPRVPRRRPDIPRGLTATLELHLAQFANSTTDGRTSGSSQDVPGSGLGRGATQRSSNGWNRVMLN